ncbi:hypothetical protein H0H81_011529 [Sphagnurus paluster]|uniref:Uncharacterized protein n=1 Tax=Sphagnurus paluster TaxID=117069 RepID=A0A9P7GPB9_9AGAR|nr:hypothetical protein H0H81_011529 [Sphagnurus paluster]
MRFRGFKRRKKRKEPVEPAEPTKLAESAKPADPADPAEPAEPASATGADVFRTCLSALKKSSDAFPPLKSAAGAILSVWDVAERANRHRKKARRLASQCSDMLQSLPSTSLHQQHCDICKRMPSKIKGVLQNINAALEKLDGLERQLEEAYQAFQLVSTVCQLEGLTAIHEKSAKLQDQIKVNCDATLEIKDMVLDAQMANHDAILEIKDTVLDAQMANRDAILEMKDQFKVNHDAILEMKDTVLLVQMVRGIEIQCEM